MMIDLNVGVYFKSSHAARGAMAEKQLAKALRKAGYTVKRHYNKGNDLTVISPDGVITKIEVKFSSLNKDGKYRATCYNTTQDASKSDVIVLLCQQEKRGGKLIPFIIPVSQVNTKRIVITNKCPESYNGKLAEYRNNWSIIQ